MRYGSIPGVGDRVSRLVLGSMVFSTEPEAFENTCRLLDRFAAAGGTTVDTARIYAGGTSESAFGQWLERSGRRSEMVVLGKGAHHNNQTLERRVTPAAIHEDVETSLREMRLETIDIYILHKDDTDAEVGPIVEALNEEAAGRSHQGLRRLQLDPPAHRRSQRVRRCARPPAVFRLEPESRPGRAERADVGGLRLDRRVMPRPWPGIRRPARQCSPGRPRRADSSQVATAPT